jgi:hypothetical protein
MATGSGLALQYHPLLCVLTGERASALALGSGAAPCLLPFPVRSAPFGVGAEGRTTLAHISRLPPWLRPSP